MTEISREWLSKIKKKRHMPPNGQVIDYGIIDFNDKPQVFISKTNSKRKFNFKFYAVIYSIHS